MKKNLNSKIIVELINELEANEKVIERALKEFKGKSVAINTCMYSSVNSMICLKRLDWTYLIGSNQQDCILITEEPFYSKIEISLIFDIDNIDEVEYSNSILRIWFQDGFRLYISTI